MPAGVFRCADGELMLVVGKRRASSRETCAVLGSEGLATNPKFAVNKRPCRSWEGDHGRYSRGFFPKKAGRLLAGRAGEGRRALRAGSTIFAQVFWPTSMLRRAAAWEIKVNHPFEHALSLIRNSDRLLRNAGEGLSRAAAYWERNTSEVLATIGYDDAKLDALKKEKII